MTQIARGRFWVAASILIPAAAIGFAVFIAPSQARNRNISKARDHIISHKHQLEYIVDQVNTLRPASNTTTFYSAPLTSYGTITQLANGEGGTEFTLEGGTVIRVIRGSENSMCVLIPLFVAKQTVLMAAYSNSSTLPAKITSEANSHHSHIIPVEAHWWVYECDVAK